MAIAPTTSREIELFEPHSEAVYTIEMISRLVNVPRRAILVYCKYQLVSPAIATTDNGYYFDFRATKWRGMTSERNKKSSRCVRVRTNIAQQPK